MSLFRRKYFEIETGFIFRIKYNKSNVRLRDFMIAEKFTQIVWMSTTNVGFAMHILHEINAYSVLGFYLPPGNQKDQFRANVFRPQSAEEPIA